MINVLKTLNNENGTVLIAAILILVLLTLLGITGIYSSNTEKNIAVNDQIYKMTFYAAEAGKDYALSNTKKEDMVDELVNHPEYNLVGPNNSSPGSKMYFPDNANPTVVYPLNSNLSFNGFVQYDGTKGYPSPRGSGSSVGEYEAHWYTVRSIGYGPRNSRVEVEAGGYRMGPAKSGVF